MKKTKVDHYTDKEALEFHSHKKPGKIEIVASKNMITKISVKISTRKRYRQIERSTYKKYRYIKNIDI